MSFDAARVQKELVEIERDKTSGVSVEVIGNSIAHMHGSIKGVQPSGICQLVANCCTADENGHDARAIFVYDQMKVASFHRVRSSLFS